MNYLNKLHKFWIKFVHTVIVYLDIESYVRYERERFAYTHFVGREFKQVVFRECEFVEVIFESCVFKHCEWVENTLENTVYRNCRFVNCTRQGQDPLSGVEAYQTERSNVI